MSEAVVVGSQSGGSLHALAAHAADQLQLEQNQQQESEVTHAAKRPLRVAAPKPGAHEGFDGEPYYDGHSEDEYREKDAERGALVLPAIQGGGSTHGPFFERACKKLPERALSPWLSTEEKNMKKKFVFSGRKKLCVTANIFQFLTEKSPKKMLEKIMCDRSLSNLLTHCPCMHPVMQPYIECVHLTRKAWSLKGEMRGIQDEFSTI